VATAPHSVTQRTVDCCRHTTYIKKNNTAAIVLVLLATLGVAARRGATAADRSARLDRGDRQVPVRESRDEPGDRGHGDLPQDVRPRLLRRRLLPEKLCPLHPPRVPAAGSRVGAGGLFYSRPSGVGPSNQRHTQRHASRLLKRARAF